MKSWRPEQRLAYIVKCSSWFTSQTWGGEVSGLFRLQQEILLDVLANDLAKLQVQHEKSSSQAFRALGLSIQILYIST